MNRPNLLAEVNRSIRDLAAKGAAADGVTWEFICECGEAGCTDRVGLSLAEYDELRNADVALLAPGHPRRRSREAQRRRRI